MKVKCEVEVDLDTFFEAVDVTDVVENYREADALAELMDAIGKETCAEHFDLVEKGSETET